LLFKKADLREEKTKVKKEKENLQRRSIVKRPIKVWWSTFYFELAKYGIQEGRD